MNLNKDDMEEHKKLKQEYKTWLCQQAYCLLVILEKVEQKKEIYLSSISSSIWICNLLIYYTIFSRMSID